MMARSRLRGSDRVRLVSVVLCLLVALAWAARSARAETVVEAWRSPFGTPHSASVDPRDGSIWAISGAWVVHLAADGTVLYRNDNLPRPMSISLDAVGDRVYVGLAGPWGDFTNDATVVCLTTDGAEVWRRVDFPGPPIVQAGYWSVWVGRGPWQIDSLYGGTGYLSRLSFMGDAVWDAEYPGAVVALSAGSSYDSGCWVSYESVWGDRGLLHLSADGGTLGEYPGASSVSVSNDDGSCWVATGDPWWDDAPGLTRLAADGSVVVPSFTPTGFTAI